MSPKAKAYAAFLITAVLGAFAQLIALGIVTGGTAKIVEAVSAAVIPVAAYYGVYSIPNGTPAPNPPAA